jgi:hypothetical protein
LVGAAALSFPPKGGLVRMTSNCPGAPANSPPYAGYVVLSMGLLMVAYVKRPE